MIYDIKFANWFIVFNIKILACQSDDDPAPENTRLSAIITMIKDLPNDTVTFGYDSQDRIIRVGSEHFTYGNNGKVISSRIHSVVKRNFRNDEMVKQCVYKWDQQGRLETIILDSLHIKRAISSHIVTTPTEISLWKDITLAKFHYEGSQSKPSKIVYRKTNTGIPYYIRVIGIGEEQSTTYHYDGEDITYSQYNDFFINQDFYNNPVRQFTNIHIYTFNRYSDKPHYLSEIYKKMGFNPLAIDEVIPAKQVEHSVTTEKSKTNIALYTADWGRAAKYQTVYDARGLPAEITSPGKSLDNGMTTLELKIHLKYTNK